MRNFWLLLFVLLPVMGMGQVITTVVGGGVSGLLDGVPATASSISSCGAIVFDKKGNYFYADLMASKIRKVNSAGIITTIAGTGSQGYGGDGGNATTAQLRFPSSMVFDSVGNLFISDHQNYRIRKIDAITGIITTVAGTGVLGDAGDGGPATAALFFPQWLLFDRQGNLYISDDMHHKIRKINQSGIISTFAGTGVFGFSGDGGPATAANLQMPQIMTIDGNGNIYFTEGTIRHVRKIDPSGIISTFAGTGLMGYNGDGLSATATHMAPGSLAFFSGKLYIGDIENLRVRVVDEAGIVHTVAGNGLLTYNGDNIPATAAHISQPASLVFDSCGNLYFGDVDNRRIRKVTFNIPPCEHLGINNQDEEKRPIVYPNPATTEIIISAPGKIKEVRVYDLLGQVVETSPGLSKGEEVLRIPVAGLSPGVYFVRIVDEDGGVVVRRVVKE